MLSEKQKQQEILLQEIALKLPQNRIHQQKTTTVTLQLYHCDQVQAIVSFLRDFTYAKDLGHQHNALKILFNLILYPNRGRVEYPIEGNKIDIYVDDLLQKIEVKTITSVTQTKIAQKMYAVVKQDLADVLWIFFFYQIQDTPDHPVKCKYLLTFIVINLMKKFSITRLNNQVNLMVEKSKVRAAQKLKIPEDILIPVDNILKVEDLERELAIKQANYEKAMKLKDEELVKNTQELAKKDQELAKKDQEIQELREKLKRSK